VATLAAHLATRAQERQDAERGRSGARRAAAPPHDPGEIEDNLSEKILFGRLTAGQIVTVDVEGTGPEAQFTFEAVPKPDEVPDAPPAEIDSKTAAGRTGGHLTNGE
jgi:hypothetical protein